MAKLLSFPAKPPHVTTETALMCVDRALWPLEEQWLNLRLRLGSLRGAARVKAEFACRELEAEIAELSRRRLRIVGAELALIPGGAR